MSGTRAGGLKVKAKNLSMNPNFYQAIGSLGGSVKVSKGFGKMPKDKAIEAGRKGGKVSRRRKEK